MPGDEKEHCRRSQRNEHRIVEPPGHAQVDLKVDHGKEVAEQAVEQGQPLDGYEVLAAENLHRGAEQKSRGRQRHHAEQAEPEEQAPGVPARTTVFSMGRHAMPTRGRKSPEPTSTLSSTG